MRIEIGIEGDLVVILFCKEMSLNETAAFTENICQVLHEIFIFVSESV